MNCLNTVCLYLVFAVTLIVPRTAVLAATIPEKPQEGRLLFVVEVSAATDNDRTTIRNSMRSILESGLGGHMQYGDTIGLWVYGEKVNTEFPMTMWTHEHLQDVENAIDFWMTKQKFKGRADFSQVVPPLQKVIKASQKLTIIWISSGDGQITGTPFDKEIAELHKEFASDFRKQHVPFVTLLAVRKGSVVDFTVNPGDAKIRLPDVFDKEAAAAALAATNTPAPEPTPPQAKKSPLIIRVGPSPELLAQKNTNAPIVANAASPLPTNSSATTTVAATNAVVQKMTTNTAAVAQPPNAPAAVSTNASAPDAAAKPAATMPTPAAPTKAVVVTNSQPVINTNAPVAAMAPTNNTNIESKSGETVQRSKPSTPASKPAAVPPATTAIVSTPPNYTLIGIGTAILVLAAGAIVFFVKKSSAPKGPSFISQSMTRERFNSDASKPSSDNPAAPE